MRRLSLLGGFVVLALLLAATPALAKGKKPDLKALSVSAPSSVDVGTAFEVTDAVKNVGKKAAKPSKVTFSLSSSASPGASGSVVLGTRSVPKLKPKKQSSGSTSLKSSAEPGDYFLLACVAGKSKEKSKGNNCRSTALRLAAADPVQPAAASLRISPANGTFASTLVGGVSPPTTFTVTNDGGQASGPISSELGAAPFSGVPAADTCTGETLAPGASCSFDIVFSPTVRGPAQSQVSLQADPGGTVSAPISGTGLASAKLSISDSTGPDPVSWSFGQAVVGSDATAHTFTITNEGDVPTGALTSELTGGNSGDFILTGGTCGAATLGAGASCTVIANFHPLTNGIKQTTLKVSSSPGGNVTTGLSGQGQTPAALTLSPLLHNYGGVPFNSSADFTFTINNSGQATSSAIALSISGTNANRFAVVGAGDSCSGQTLTSGASCSFTVRFTPGNVGAKSAFVNFNAAVGGAGSASLSGSGT